MCPPLIYFPEVLITYKVTICQDNTRNGYTPKTVKSKFGEIDLDVPRDRKSDFEPQIVKKRQKDISGLEEKIISMYAKGMTTRDIQAHIKDLYGYEISPETVSSITDKVMERAREWQGRPLESVYALIYMDAVFLKMRLEGHVRNVALYTIIGINLDGQKECLGLWICGGSPRPPYLRLMAKQLG